MEVNKMRDLDSKKEKLWSGHCRVSRLWLGVNVTTDKVLHLDLILLDSKGNDIWVLIPPVLQNKFKQLLKQHNVYIIKDFDIKATGLTHQTIANPYVMSFTRKTTVQHIPDIPSIPTFKFTFMKASDMASKKEETVILSDVVGELVQHSNVIKTSNITWRTIRKELQMKLIEGDVVKVTIQGRVIEQLDKIVNDAGERQIILVVTAVTVNEFKEVLSYSSSGSTVLYDTPDIPAVTTFTTRNVEPELPIFVEHDADDKFPAVSLAELQELPMDPDNEEMDFSVECKVIGIKAGWCYMGCPSCVYKPIERQGQSFCVRCNKNTPVKAARYRVKLEVQSESNSTTFIVFDYEAHQFFGISAHELFDKTGQNSTSPSEKLLEIVGTTKEFHVKFKFNPYEDGQADFTVLRILDDTAQEKDLPLHKDGSSSSITTGSESSQPSPYANQIANLEESDGSVKGPETSRNKLKRKMPLE
ncbi:unnamed protein product [Linum trigynum]|uniref:Replication factor A C-terminal domain-containing protein n=1 Tax=Linum trigynum TaxID=586398 RepID=A0AAV2CT85_9ROSI